jgi:hypothetical protein
MKCLRMLISSALLIAMGSVYPQSGTYDFYLGATQDGRSISQTVSGVTLTIHSDNTIGSMTLQDWSAYPPFTNNAATMNGIDNPSCTFVFSQPVNLSTILVADFNSGRPHLLFTPNTGSSVNGSVDADNGTYFTLNFVQITSFVITNFVGGTVNLGFDQVVMTAPPSVTFTDGGAFTPVVTRGSINQAIGRFRLTGNISGAALTAASIRLDGVRTGLSNLELWQSTDATFGSDTQVGSSVAADPGNGNSVSFSGFSSSIATGGTYYFLTGNLASDAEGKVHGVIIANGNLTLSNGTLSGTIVNAQLSSGDASLPVGLSAFSARAEGRSIILSWITESETDNLGFILERSDDGNSWTTTASYKTIDALRGKGNTSSRTEYSFEDGTAEPGNKYFYRLSDVSTGGDVTAHASLSIQTDAVPGKTEMTKAFPNPFNPRTFIAYNLAEGTFVRLSVFDMLGRRVKTLHSGHQPAGSYHEYWNGTDDGGNKVPSGGYIIQMATEETRQTQKVLLTK